MCILGYIFAQVYELVLVYIGLPKADVTRGKKVCSTCSKHFSYAHYWLHDDHEKTFSASCEPRETGQWSVETRQAEQD